MQHYSMEHAMFKNIAIFLNFIREKKECGGGFGERKENGEMMQLYFHLKNKIF